VPELRVNAETEGRADQILAALTPLSRSALKTRLLSFTVNGKAAKLSAKVRPGEELVVAWADEEALDAPRPEKIPVEVLYEDAAVTVVNKPQGLVTHPGAGNATGTLLNALLGRWGETARGGLVHRLDKDTSGVIVAARTGEAETWLREQFASRRVRKEYIAISYGRPPASQGNIKTHLARSRQDRKKFCVVAPAPLDKATLAAAARHPALLDSPTEPTTVGLDPDAPPIRGRYAHTAYHVVACYGPYTLFRLRLKTGRTHQIRVHLAHIGCPILGDPLYGSRKNDAAFTAAAGFVPTLMLHSYVLGIRLAPNAPFSTFTAPVPLRFKRVLRFLHNTFPKNGGRLG
jgi:23S rRNA pseudouridine1911/1915/1917 synthase